MTGASHRPICLRRSSFHGRRPVHYPRGAGGAAVRARLPEAVRLVGRSRPGRDRRILPPGRSPAGPPDGRPRRHVSGGGARGRGRGAPAAGRQLGGGGGRRPPPPPPPPPPWGGAAGVIGTMLVASMSV